LQAGNAVSFFGYGLILPFEIIYLHQIRGFATATASVRVPGARSLTGDSALVMTCHDTPPPVRD
jgi:hypothetical protein